MLINKTRKCFAIFILFFIFISSLFAQKKQIPENDIKNNAELYFESSNYIKACPLYSQLLSLHPKDALYNYCFGVSLLLTDKRDVSKPLKYLMFSALNGDYPQAYYYIALAYQCAFRFKEAIKTYEVFKTKTDSKTLQRFDVQHQIEMCYNGIELLKSLTDIYVLSNKIVSKNSFYRSYKMPNIGGKFLKKPDFLLSKIDKKKNNNNIVYYSDSTEIMYYSSYGKDGKTGKDIYYVERISDLEWSKPIKLSEAINTAYDEDYPYMMMDGKTLYFCSKGHNSMGGYDIFISYYDEINKEWTTPINLDFPINTPYDDILMVTDTNSKYAYFASDRNTTSDKISVYKVRIDKRQISETDINTSILSSDEIDGTVYKETISFLVKKASLEVNATYKMFGDTLTDKTLTYIEEEIKDSINKVYNNNEETIFEEDKALHDKIISDAFVKAKFAHNDFVNTNNLKYKAYSYSTFLKQKSADNISNANKLEKKILSMNNDSLRNNYTFIIKNLKTLAYELYNQMLVVNQLSFEYEKISLQKEKEADEILNRAGQVQVFMANRFVDKAQIINQQIDSILSHSPTYKALPDLVLSKTLASNEYDTNFNKLDIKKVDEILSNYKTYSTDSLLMSSQIDDSKENNSYHNAILQVDSILISVNKSDNNKNIIINKKDLSQNNKNKSITPNNNKKSETNKLSSNIPLLEKLITNIRKKSDSLLDISLNYNELSQNYNKQADSLSNLISSLNLDSEKVKIINVFTLKNKSLILDAKADDALDASNQISFAADSFQTYLSKYKSIYQNKLETRSENDTIFNNLEDILVFKQKLNKYYKTPSLKLSNSNIKKSQNDSLLIVNQELILEAQNLLTKEQRNIEKIKEQNEIYENFSNNLAYFSDSLINNTKKLNSENNSILNISDSIIIRQQQALILAKKAFVFNKILELSKNELKFHEANYLNTYRLLNEINYSKNEISEDNLIKNIELLNQTLISIDTIVKDPIIGFTDKLNSSYDKLRKENDSISTIIFINNSNISNLVDEKKAIQNTLTKTRNKNKRNNISLQIEDINNSLSELKKDSIKLCLSLNANTNIINSNKKQKQIVNNINYKELPVVDNDFAREQLKPKDNDLLKLNEDSLFNNKIERYIGDNRIIAISKAIPDSLTNIDIAKSDNILNVNNIQRDTIPNIQSNFISNDNISSEILETSNNAKENIKKSLINISSADTISAYLVLDIIDILSKQVVVLKLQSQYLFKNDEKLENTKKIDNLNYIKDSLIYVANNIIGITKTRASYRNARQIDNQILSIENNYKSLLQEALNIRNKINKTTDIEDKKLLESIADSLETIAYIIQLREFVLVSQSKQVKINKIKHLIECIRLPGLADEESIIASLLEKEAQYYISKALVCENNYYLTSDNLQKNSIIQMKIRNEQIAIDKLIKASEIYKKINIHIPSDSIIINNNKLYYNNYAYPKTNNIVSEKIKEEIPINNLNINAVKIVEKDIVSNKIIIKNSTDLNRINKLQSIDSLPMGLIYLVQFIASKNNLEENAFKGITSIYTEKIPDNSYIRYMKGVYNSENDIMPELISIKANAFKDAFLVAYFNRKRININEAKLIIQKDRGVSIKNNNIPLVDVKKDSLKLILGINNTSRALVFYTVQIGVFASSRNSNQLFNLSDLFYDRLHNGYWRYYSGIFTDETKAIEYKNRFVKENINDAFVVRFSNGEKVAIYQNINNDTLINKVIKKQTFTKDTSIVFKVQIGALKNVNNNIPKSLIYNGKQIAIERLKIEDNTVFVCGSFKTYNDAKSFTDKVKSLGYKDSFIVAYKNRKRISINQALSNIK